MKITLEQLDRNLMTMQLNRMALSVAQEEGMVVEQPSTLDHLDAAIWELRLSRQLLAAVDELTARVAKLEGN